ncbi:MAG: DUF1559 domain-containing protein, partial [Candidatus Omnitrophica bacterium]|nr:DUF1559 domain-containing protein [Candidatus Omnitrophota bacterium]
QARERARRAVCMSNLKQLGLALMMYADEWDGYLPVAHNTSYKSWDQHLYSSLNVTYPSKMGPFKCPTDKTVGTRSYSINAGNSYESDTGVSWHKYGTHGPGSVRFASLRDPSNTVLLLEFHYKHNDKDSNSAVGYANCAGYHSGSANYLFCDLHVKSHKPEDLTLGNFTRAAGD